MLPHNQVEQGSDLRNRRKMFTIFMGVAGLLFLTAILTDDQKNPINEMQHCKEEDLFTINQTNQECYIYHLFQNFTKKHFKGFLNHTYTHFHAFQYNQIKPEFNLSILYSQSPYLDDLQNSFQFSFGRQQFKDLWKSSQILEMNHTHNDCVNTLTLQMNNLTQNNISFMDVVVEIKCQDEVKRYSGQVKDNSDEIEGHVITYSFLNTIICLCSMINGLKILRGLIEGQENIEEYSMISIGFIMIQDIYMCLFNFFQAMQSEKLFQYFITPSFLQFLLFSIFEMRILMILWRSRLRMQDNFRNQVIKFYVSLYLCMFSGMFIIYEFITSQWLLFFLSLYLVPQILHSAQRGQFVRINLKYIIGFLLPRVLNIIYFRIYPNNIFYLKPMPVLVVIICLGVIAQIIVYILQNEWGPQFFVPKTCLPQKYNYYLKIPITNDLEMGPNSESMHLFSEECSICMMPIHQSPILRLTPEEERNFMIKQAVKMHKQNYMKTPCDHKFHVACLVKWMTIKLSCPSCRTALPPL